MTDCRKPVLACPRVFLALLAAAPLAAGPGPDPARSPYARWRQGPPARESYFPIAVWLQDPADATRYRQAGFNLYVGLWKGPTGEQLGELKKAGMQVICSQNEVGLRPEYRDTVVGWMHGDEPDNAQPLPGGKGYGPPIPPETIVEDYERLRQRDPSRPVLLNLGQGVAWDRWHGRGVRTNHPEDYPLYARGGDIVSFDIYPVVHRSPEVAGKLEFVPRGVKRLVDWTGGKKIIWNCIECTRISNAEVKPTPRQVRAEVWMSLIHGSRGLIYFVHQFRPKFNSRALFADRAMLEGVSRLNRQIHELAPVLNSPSLEGPVAVSVSAESPGSGVPVATLVKRHGGRLHVFAVCMRDTTVTARFTFADRSVRGSMEVIGEQRRVPVKDRTLSDTFEGYEVHLYRQMR